MRWARANLFAVFLRTAISTAIGAAVFGTVLAYQYSLLPFTALVVTVIALFPLALPTAIAINLTLFLTLKADRQLTGWIAGCLAGVVATVVFPIYMTPGTPAINWREEMLLPAATSLATLIIWIMISSRKGTVS